MFGFLLAIMILDALILAAVVLMQAGQGGGLASLGGGGVQAIGGRQATTILTKATWICGGIFMGLALILSAIAPGGGASSSSEVQQRLEQGLQQQPQTQVPVSPLQGTAPPPATPAPTGSTTP
jgi:preprotein translocase subunit SecG